jgi:signal transduction histidine kinase
MAVVVTTLWLVWRSRESERRRANSALATVERLQTVADGTDGVAHDVNNLLSSVAMNLSGIDQLVLNNPEEASEVIEDASSALYTATRLLAALRSEVAGVDSDATTADFVRLQAALHRKIVPMDVNVQADLAHGGQWEAAARILQNLFANAVREARATGGRVQVWLSEGELSIGNPVRAPEMVQGDIFEPGVSHSGSSGRGLHVARELARQIGWSIHHEVEGSHVRFVIRTNEHGSAERKSAESSQPMTH